MAASPILIVGRSYHLALKRLPLESEYLEWAIIPVHHRLCSKWLQTFPGLVDTTLNVPLCFERIIVLKLQFLYFRVFAGVHGRHLLFPGLVDTTLNVPLCFERIIVLKLQFLYFRVFAGVHGRQLSCRLRTQHCNSASAVVGAYE